MPGALTFAVVETPLSNAKEKDTASVDTALSVDGYLSNTRNSAYRALETLA